MNEEQWKEIRQFEGRYEVSSLGQVRNIKTQHILKPVVNHKGYLTIKFNTKGKEYKFSVHRLVAMVFIPNDNEDYTQIDHINRVKTDNRVENLRWVNNSMNSLNRDFMNMKLSKRNKTGKIGVRFKDKKYEVYIGTKNRKIYGGRYNTFEEAVKRREELEKEYFK